MVSGTLPIIDQTAGSSVRRWTTGIFFAIALLLGGGSMYAAPGATAIIQLAAVVALAVSVATAGRIEIDRQARAAVALLVLVVLLVVVQLVPLPADLWRSLPGHALAAGIRDLVGAGALPHALSLDPDATRATGLAMLPAAAAFICGLYASGNARRMLLLVIIAFAGFDLILGMLQFATGGQFSLYPGSFHNGRALGVFANRNQNAMLLIIAPLLVAAYLRAEPTGRWIAFGRPLVFGALILFLVGVLATSSRAGLVLAALSGIGVLVIVASRGADFNRTRGTAAAVGLVVLIAVVSLIMLSDNRVAQSVLTRFDTAFDDQRFQIWPNAIYAAKQFMPWGSGLGTFDAVYRTLEPLDTVGEFYINHAHNEYLEIAIEAGIPGLILVGLFLILFASRIFTEFVSRRGQVLNPVATAAIFTLLILLLHALVEYPTRTPTLGVVFGFACALLYAPARPRRVAGG